MGSNGGGKVRVVARIKGPLSKDVENLPVSKPWILVSRPDPSSSGRVKISFSSDQINSGKQSYEVDECYEQGVRNKEIFNNEIKPLISGVFRGQNITVFAYGPRGSGKTFTVQGSEEEVGLTVLTMDSVLLRAEEERKVVKVSVFEVFQERITDLLDSNSSEVSVFEDGQGNIRLRGLSKVKVNSTEEFRKLYHNAANVRLQKSAELAHRCHSGYILHVVSPKTENSSAKLVGKINFIDLASYGDSRRNSSDRLNLAESTSIKKSLTAVHNVLYALNSKDRVSYRESKLTRMLQDSLGESSRILMVACMKPSFCQETAQTISVASRSCIAGFLAYLNPGKSGRSTNKTMGMSSPQTMKSASKLPTRTDLMSPKVVKKPTSASTSVRKHTGSRLQTSVQKELTGSRLQMSVQKEPTGSRLQKSVQKTCGGVSGVAVKKEKRKLFDDCNQAKTPKRENVRPVVASSIDSSVQLQEKSTVTTCSDVDSSRIPSEKASHIIFNENPTQIEEKSTVTTCSDVDSSRVPSEKASHIILNSQEKSTVTTCSDVDSSQIPSEKASHIILNENPTQAEEKSTVTTCSDVDSSQIPSENDVLQVENNVTIPCVYKTPTTQSSLNEDKENQPHDGSPPPLSSRLQELSNNLKSLCISTGANLKITQDNSKLFDQVIHEDMEPKTPTTFQPSANASDKYDRSNNLTPWTSFHGMKDSLVHEYLKFLNSASKNELRRIRGIGEKRADYIMELREESPEPFKVLDDLKDIGLSEKKITGLMKNVAENLFT